MFTLIPTTIFDDWLNDLRDRRAAANIAKRLVRVEAGNLGDVKSVGGRDKGSRDRDIERAKEIASQL